MVIFSAGFRISIAAYHVGQHVRRVVQLAHALWTRQERVVLEHFGCLLMHAGQRSRNFIGRVEHYWHR